MQAFLSAAPEVELVNFFRRPFENAVATARTCYSDKDLVTAEEVGGDHEADPAEKAKRAERRDRLARSIYKAGHHTTLQHAHFQFALRNVSRQFLWTFLHSHPFYNSEQVSQRYVEVKPGNLAIPPLEGEARALFEKTTQRQLEVYRNLIERLLAPVEADYLKRFPKRADSGRAHREVKKKAYELARYVLPVSTFAYLYHTISALTLLRYHRMCAQFDAPLETRLVVEKMVAELLRVDPLFRTILEEPLPLEQTLEYEFFRSVPPGGEAESPIARRFVEEFDGSLEGRLSKLIDAKGSNETVLADAVREVLGVPRARLPENEAIEMVMNPARNRYFSEALNVTTLSKLSRTLSLPGYTFRKKLSHTADSQDQRHRTTPASRPLLFAHLSGEPDYVVPELVKQDEALSRDYARVMERIWEAYARLIRMGVPKEHAAYVMPNAVPIRFTQSVDLLNLHHKIRMRLCFNSQEEIWRASLDEAQQVTQVNPRLGCYLLPPCGLRRLARVTPRCPEGDRACGVDVWNLALSDYERTI